MSQVIDVLMLPYVFAMDFLAGWIGADAAWRLMSVLPFVLPAGFALFSRSITALGVVVGLGVLSLLAASAAIQVPTSRDLMDLVYFGSFGISLVYAFQIVILRGVERRLLAERARLLMDMEGMGERLDRELLWRRAGGDDRPLVVDQEIMQIVDRVHGVINRKSAQAVANVSPSP